MGARGRFTLCRLHLPTLPRATCRRCLLCCFRDGDYFLFSGRSRLGWQGRQVRTYRRARSLGLPPSSLPSSAAPERAYECCRPFAVPCPRCPVLGALFTRKHPLTPPVSVLYAEVAAEAASGPNEKRGRQNEFRTQNRGYNDPVPNTPLFLSCSRPAPVPPNPTA